MKRFGWTGLVSSVLGLFCLPWPLLGQERLSGEWKYRVELFGEVAHGRFYNGKENWGNGLDFGGGFGIRPFSGRLHGLQFEFRGARLSGDRTAVGRSSALTSRLVTADVVYHFGRTRVQPYLFGGVGFVKTHYFVNCSECVFNQDPVTGQLTPVPNISDVRDSKVGDTFGGGLKIAVHRHLSIRSEILFADTTPGSGWNWEWLRVQVGLGCHF